LVVVSDDDDKKISLWRKTGQSTGTIPPVGTDSGGNNIEEIEAAVELIISIHIQDHRKSKEEDEMKMRKNFRERNKLKTKTLLKHKKEKYTLKQMREANPFT
nr:hypothetical protein [Tanacetum cinerariifolium]